MSRYIDADALMSQWCDEMCKPKPSCEEDCAVYDYVRLAPSIDIVRCKDCRKSHIDGKTTHYLWCTEWGRSTDTFGYCERGEREGE